MYALPDPLLEEEHHRRAWGLVDMVEVAVDNRTMDFGDCIVEEHWQTAEGEEGEGNCIAVYLP